MIIPGPNDLPDQPEKRCPVARPGVRALVPLVIGAVLLVVGAVWMAQGVGLLPGSFMTGDRRWFWFGLASALFGVALLMAGIRQLRAGRG